MSEGLNEVSIEAMLEAGDWEDLNLERNRRLYLRGMGFNMEGQTKGNLDFVYVVEGEEEAA